MTLHSRAQASMPDLLFATLFFFIMLAGLFFYASNIQDNDQSIVERRLLDNAASNLAEFIIKNPGTPVNWEYLPDFNQTEQIGLAIKDRVLSPDKVVAFVNQGNSDYALTKQKLRLTQFEFHAQFSGGVSLSTGLAPGANKNASVVQRLVTINGVETQFTLTVYDS